MAYVIGDDCIACGTCIDECPAGAISEGENILSILTCAQSVALAQMFVLQRLSAFLKELLQEILLRRSVYYGRLIFILCLYTAVNA